ncbi:MAG: PrsW family glutamic-type intramembrane protease [Planctomycetota bacterium]
MSDHAKDAGYTPGEINPFAVPAHRHEKPRIDADPSVFAEPWMQNVIHGSAPDSLPGLNQEATTDIEPEDTVWDEPALANSLSDGVSGQSWFQYFLQKSQQTSPVYSWWVTCCTVIVAGPLAIVGTLVQGMISSGLTLVVVMGPTTEEIMKVAIPLWIVERRPWWFRSSAQILVCGFCSGLAFAAVENVMYLNLYVPNPTLGLTQWRWSVCVLMHAGCSVIASLGVARIWQQVFITRSRPELSSGALLVFTAILLHGTYNAMAMLLEYSGIAF